MRKSLIITVVAVISLSLVLAPVAALAQQDTGIYVFEKETSAEAMIGDALVVRPISILCLGATSLVFLVGWPFAAAGGNSAEAKQKLLKDPVDYTFKRPLGEF
jgi:hypothetical protein